jgi:hypothetical protein
MISARFAFLLSPVILSPVILVFVSCASSAPERGGVTDNTPESVGVTASDLSPTPTVCDGNRLLLNVAPVVTSCCQLGNDNWFISPRNGGIAHLTYNGHPCSTADGGPDCVGFDCEFGPCQGEKIVEVLGTAPSFVFKPLSNPNVCGYQAGGDGFFPEAYDHQQLWPETIVKCPWTSCPGGGVPGVQLEVITQTNGATGQVESKPLGIALVGQGDVSAIFTQLNVKLTAKGLGPHAIVHFFGACVAVGRAGQSVQCPVTLGGDKVVTVSYECESGFTCQL